MIIILINNFFSLNVLIMIKAQHTGKMLNQFVRKNRLFQSGWARQQGVYPTTIARYLKNPTMRVDTLFTICQVL
jgi:hypothetical protein